MIVPRTVNFTSLLQIMVFLSLQKKLQNDGGNSSVHLYDTALENLQLGQLASWMPMNGHIIYWKCHDVLATANSYTFNSHYQ